MFLLKLRRMSVITSQVCQLRAQKQSADASVEEERRNAERQVQFYLRKLDELRSYLSAGQYYEETITNIFFVF